MSLRRLTTGFLIASGLAGCSVETPGPPTAPASTTPAPVPASPSREVSKSAQGAPPLLSSKTKDRVDIAALLTRSEAALQSNNFLGAYQAADEVLQADPQNRRGLSLMARAAQQQAALLQRPANSPFYLRSGDAMRRLRDLKTELTTEEKTILPGILYNEACTSAFNGDPARALALLNEAYDAGLGRPELLDIDAELDSLRKLPEFQKLQVTIERRNVEAMLASAKPHAFNFSLPDVDGKTVKLDDVKGEITIVDFWGTWCPPCRKEIPHLIDLANRYKAKGLRVVGLTYEQQEGAEATKAVREFIKDYGINYPCLIGDVTTQKRLSHFEGFPTTLFLDREGKVRLQITGYQSLIALETIVEVLLAGDKPEAKKSP